MSPNFAAVTSVLRKTTVILALVTSTACAALSELRAFVQPPRFEQADGRPAEIRLVTFSREQPLGGANVRIWMRVVNPNPFGVTLSTLRTTLLLDERHAADGDFPLGLPLGASADSVIPIDLAVDFRDVPGLSNVIRSAVGGNAVDYELQGTVGVDAGRLGTPTFGPMSFVHGEIGGSRPGPIGL
jgi:hypothetical protein